MVFNFTRARVRASAGCAPDNELARHSASAKTPWGTLPIANRLKSGDNRNTMAKSSTSSASSASPAPAAPPAGAPAVPALPATYEAALQELEGLVSGLESGQLPLDQLLTGYQRGAQLLAFCKGKLEAVETQIKVLEGTELKPWA